jgi:hypothetical protein
VLHGLTRAFACMIQRITTAIINQLTSWVLSKGSLANQVLSMSLV